MDAAALLPTVERTTGTDPQWAVVWLHGLGADGHDFAPMVPELVRPGWPAIRFVFPHAPERAVTINGGMRMRAWYDIVAANLTDRADAQGLAESVDQVEALIAAQVARGIPGCPPGGGVTGAAGRRRRDPLAGRGAGSPSLPQPARAPAALAPGAATQPVFMAHGALDPVIPLAAGAHSAAVLRGLGFQVDWHAYPMAHAVCAEEIAALAQWLTRRFGG